MWIDVLVSVSLAGIEFYKVDARQGILISSTLSGLFA